MVGWDMVTRLRPDLGVLAAVALLALGCLSPGTSEHTTPIADRHDAVAVAKACTTPTAPIRAPRPVLPLIVLLVTMAVPATTVVGGRALIGRHRRRPGDVGDDWRSLLLGAPPGLA